MPHYKNNYIEFQAFVNLFLRIDISSYYSYISYILLFNTNRMFFPNAKNCNFVDNFLIASSILC